MGIAVLAKVSMIITGIVRGGYALAGGYLIKTGVRYVQDYKTAIEQDKMFNEIKQ